MVFDPTINLGNVLTAVGFIIAALSVWIRQEKVLQNLITELTAVRAWLERLDENGTSYSHVLAERVARVEGRPSARRV